MAITENQQTNILKIVVGLFNGGIGPSNLSILAGLIDNGQSMLHLSNVLASTPVFKNVILGGKTTVQSQVDVLMNNFGFVSNTDDASRIAEKYFTDIITAGAGFGAIVNAAVEFLSRDNLESVWKPYIDLLNNKALVAQVYVGKNAPDIVEQNIALLAGVTATSPSTLEEATAYVDIFTANKILFTSSPDNFTGTDGIDIYSAIFDPNGNATTISNSDIADGGIGEDQLNIRVGSTSGDNVIAPTLSMIESYFIKNQSTSNTFTLNFANINNESQVWDKGSISGANTKVINLSSSAVVGMENTLGFYEAHYTGDRTGNTDAFTLALNGAGSSNQAVNFSTIDTSGNNDDSFEIANISSSKVSSNLSLGVDSMTLKSINVSGDILLKLGGHDHFTGLSMVDASKMIAGGLKINAQGSTETEFTFLGSAAEDRLHLKNSTINTSSSLDSGLGKDVLATQNFNNLNSTAVNSAVGFSVLEGADGVENFSASDFTSIHEFLFTGTSSNSGSTIQNIESNDHIKFETDISSGGNYALRLEGKNAGVSATIELISSDEANGETIFTSSSNNNDRYGVEIRSNISTLNLDSNGSGSNANIIETNQNNNSFGYAVGNSNTPVVNINGSHDLVIMAKKGVDISDGNKLAGFSSAVNIDASGFTGNLRIAGSLSDDIIKGGNKSDIIYGLGGSDTLTGNEGSDQFRSASFNNNTDTITDFDQSQDKIGLNEFDFANTTSTQVGATLSLSDYVDNRAGITSIGNADEKKVIELQDSLTGGQIAADKGATIEAYILVHNSTTNKAELWYDNDWSTESSRDKILIIDNIIDLNGVKSFTNEHFVEYTF